LEATVGLWTSVPGRVQLLVEERDGVHYSLESGHRVEWAEEENWCFRLKDQREGVIKWLQDDNPIQPAQFQGQVKAWLDDPKLGDLSVSRPVSRLHWGIQVPNRNLEADTVNVSNDTIYVWLDALANYLTVAGFDENRENFRWPPTIQVIGKDILKFHAIYWPSFLLALNLPLPKKLLVHSHYMVDDVKMSKSLGNVIDPNQLIQKYSVDGARYMLLREGVPHMDGNFVESRMVHYLNLELADTLGNLLNRSCSLGVNPKQTVPAWNENFKDYETALSASLKASLENLAEAVSQSYENFNFYQGIVLIMDALRLANGFVQEEKPWELKKSNMDRLQFVLALSLETLRVSGILLSPVVPTISGVLLSKLNVPASQRTIHSATNLAWNSSNNTARELDSNKVILFKKIRD